MKYLNFKSKYDKNPIIKISNNADLLYSGFNEINEELKKFKKGVLAFESYLGVNNENLLNNVIKKLNPDKVIFIEDFSKTKEEIETLIGRNLTDDRVFGVMSHFTIDEFYHKETIDKLNKEIDKNKLTIVYGFGASLIDYDHLVPVSITRWEIQLRYRQGLSNFKAENYKEDNLRKYKRGFFVEWRVADRIKKEVYPKANYIIDLNDDQLPVMISKDEYFKALNESTKRPFRMVPYFDPGVWGGQWMKEVCNLDPSKENYAWSFDGVAEENSVKFGYGNKTIHFPAQDIVTFEPINLLGEHVHARFGLNLPIRFDLLDTMGGQNLSLQVHPRTEYIYDKFGMMYTQDESYYLLDAEEDGIIYLGFKNDVNKEDFERDMLAAEKGEISFPAEKYVNTYKAHKHDHILIPAGTIHCSATNTMVLEISACTYIFTFKMWDWDRLGLDGLPRPVHLEHGFKNVQYDYNTDFVEKNLINQFKKIDENTEVTGLHHREFLRTVRYTFNKEQKITINNNVLLGNLVEGKEAVIYSKTNEFEPFFVNYAETFVIPATFEEVMVKPVNENEKCIIVIAQVKDYA